ncbi:MAG: tetratricopeptide repeat protein [Candidatus Krumholzibacteriia bacterium]
MRRVWCTVTSSPKTSGSPRAGGDATPLYAAPEVLHAEPPTPRSDLYSAGVVAFELLSGHPPFDGTCSEELAARKARERAPALRSAGAEVPESLEAWVARMLEREAAGRFESAGGARAAWIEAHAGAAPPPKHANAVALHPEAARRLRRRVDPRRASSGVVVCVSGGPGTGKTGLLEAFEREAAERGAALLSLRPDAPAPGGLEVWGDAVQRAAAELGELTTRLLPPDAGLHAANDHAVRGAIEHALLERGDARPLRILVDAFESCDAATRWLLVRLARRAERLRLDLVVCGRDRHLDADTRRSWCALTDVCTENLRLAKPDAEGLRALVAQRLGVAGISDALASYVCERSGGNVRFAVLLVDALRSCGALRPLGDAWSFRPERAPEGVPHQLVPHVEVLLETLSPAGRAILVEASIHGRRFDTRLLASRLGRPHEELLETLHAIETDTLLAHRDGDAFVFAEALVAEHLYAHASPERKRAAHRALAELLLAQPEPDDAGIGTHLFHAGERARALPHLERAGRAALATRDAGAARAILDLACQSADAQPQNENQAAGVVELLILRAQARRQLASWDDAVLDLEQARTLAQAWGLGSGEVQAARALGEVEYARSRFDAAVQRYEAAQECAAHIGDEREHHELARQVGHLHFERGQLAAAREDYSRVLAYATANGNIDLEARAANNVALVDSSLGRKDQAVRMFSRSLGLFRSLDRQDAMARIHLNIGMTYLELHNWAEARNYFESCMKLAAPSALDEVLAVACLDHAEATLRLGQASAARPSIDRALAICRERGDTLGTASAYRLQGILAAAEGDEHLAEDRLLHSVELLRELGATPHLGLSLKELGRVRLEAGRAAAARSALEEARRVFASLDAQHEAASELETLWARCSQGVP